RTSPEKDNIARAANALSSARMPMFVCGGGVVISGAEEELAALAELLGAPVATTVSGQGSLAEDHPLCLGVVGSNGGTLPTREALSKADLVVFIGCRAGSVTSERWRYPAPGTRVIHIDADPMVPGAIYKTEVALVCDAKLALEALFLELKTKESNGKAIVKEAKA